MENEKFAHMEPSKEMLGLTNLEKVISEVVGDVPHGIPDHILQSEGFHDAMKRAVSVSGQTIPTEKESLENYIKWRDEIEQKMWGADKDSSKDILQKIDPVQVVDDLIEMVENPKEKIKVATGRKICREKKTPMESLKVQHYKIKLGAKRDEVNFVEDILDKTRERTIPVKWNVAIMNLNPLGGNLIEEGILQENLRKIQGYK